MNALIYLVKNPKGFYYIGQTTDLEKRKRRYKRLDCKAQKKLFYSFKKYGFENHTIEILEENIPLADLMLKEEFWIESLKTNCAKFPKNKGLNLCDGGIGTRGRKQSEAQKIANGNRHRGKVMSVESRKKISLAGLGRKHSDETKALMSEKVKGRNMSDETKEKLRNCFLGKPNLPNRIQVKKIDKYTNQVIKIYEMATDAAIELGDKNKIANIINACRKKLKTAYGYKWEYAR